MPQFVCGIGQVELQVPVAPAPTSSAAAASPTRGKAPAPAQPPPPLPSFAKLLQDSIVGQRTNRGWFDEQRRYQLLEQSQVPTRLPQVRQCVEISCGLPCPHAMHPYCLTASELSPQHLDTISVLLLCAGAGDQLRDAQWGGTAVGRSSQLRRPVLGPGHPSRPRQLGGTLCTGLTPERQHSNYM